MSINDATIRALQPGERRQNKSVGDSLILVIEPISAGGGKSFEGRMRFPSGRSGKQVSVRIGVYGRGLDKFSLREARDEWSRIRIWSRVNGRDPRELKQEEQGGRISGSCTQTLKDAAESYLASSSAKENTKNDYQNMIKNQILPFFGETTVVNALSWDHIGSSGKNGRETVLELINRIHARAPVQARKVLMVLRGIFDHATDQGWMERNQNPAQSIKNLARQKPTHHPTLRWEQLPKFFAELEANEANGSLITLCSIKILFMTFLRVGSLVPLRWEELDYNEELWRIPGSRMKNGRDHLVPLTEPLKDVLKTLTRINGDDEYALASPRSRGQGHMNPYSINQHFIRMGYKGVLRAHGVRSIPLTAGQEVLGYPSDIIQRQMAHVVGDRVRRAYDRGEFLEERRRFMASWCDALIAQGLTV